MLAIHGVRLFLLGPVLGSPWTSKDGGQTLIGREMVTRTKRLRPIVTTTAGV